MYRVTKALVENNREWIKGWLAGAFDAEPSSALVSKWMRKARDMLGYRSGEKMSRWNLTKSGYGWRIGDRGNGLGSFITQDYADDDWRMWFANRLEEASLWPKIGGKTEFARYTCALHVGFIGIEETPEMLERLRRVDEETKSGPATPGIERTQVKVQPIDRVAARVTQGG